MEIKNKVVIVTGASSGIGLAAARQLSKAGAKLIISARSKDLLSEFEKEIPNSFAVVCDMRKKEDIKNLVAETIKKYGRVDLLLNNAGQGMMGPVEKMNIEQYKQIMELNVFGVVSAMQEVIPHMRRQGGGMIVNISSGLTKMHVPGLSAYSSTKYALNALSHIAREELYRDKIVVSLVLPGLTATNFHKNALNSSSNWSAGRTLPEADSADKVAKKILEVIKTEEAEVSV